MPYSSLSQKYLGICLGIALITVGLPVSAQANFDCNTVVSIPVSECQALVDLYNSTNGPSRTYQYGFFSNNDPCTWNGMDINSMLNGVICNNGHVEVLFFESNNLVGSMPTTLGNLAGLVHLHMFGSNFSNSSIPASLGNLTNLNHIYLTANQLSGPIPASLGNLTNLVTLQLGSNQLSGPIPASLGNLTNLVTLELVSNQLSGPIPSTLANLSQIQQFLFGYNQYNGAIPTFLTNMVDPEYFSSINGSNHICGAVPPNVYMDDIPPVDAPLCADGYYCNVNADCQSNTCTNGVCINNTPIISSVRIAGMSGSTKYDCENGVLKQQIGTNPRTIVSQGTINANNISTNGTTPLLCKKIEGNAWKDNNNNNTYNAIGDTISAGRTVRLIQDTNIIKTMLTTSQGYRFIKVYQAGAPIETNMRVQISKPSGSVRVTLNIGLANNDSDVSINSGLSPIIDLSGNIGNINGDTKISEGFRKL